MNRPYFPVSIAMTILVVAATLAPAQLPPQAEPIVTLANDGSFAVDKSIPHWSFWALDLMAIRINVLIIYLVGDSGGDLSGAPSPGTLSFPAGVEGVKQFTALTGNVATELSPRVVLITSKKGRWVDPIIISSQRLPIGGSIDSAIREDELEWKLLETSNHMVRHVSTGITTDAAWIASYYWPAREGHGREFYVLQQSTAAVSPGHDVTRYLRKVAVETTAPELRIRDLWRESSGEKPGEIWFSGPILDLEMDFDGDGVTDIVRFTARPASEHGGGPLVILSGATGQEIGQIEGREFLITEDARGEKTIRTMSIDGFRKYKLNDEHKLVLQSFTKTETYGMPPLLKQRPNVKTEQASVASVGAGERVIDNFLTSPRFTTEHNDFQFLRSVHPLAEAMVLRQRGAKEIEGAHILLNYRPKPLAEEANPH